MKLMILDGNSIINRAFYGVRLLSTKDGLYTNAIFGFLNILDKLRADEQPDALCVAFDLKGPTFRHERYDGYKATRHPMPDELAMQMPVMKDVLRAMNIPIYEAQGWEADDVIGTVARRCGRDNWQCVIITGDRDSLQLVDAHVSVKLVSTKAGQTLTKTFTPDVFREEYGFEPLRLIDLKSLMGDSSDNIPGVAGIGPKTATNLLLEYGTLDGVYAHLSEIRETVRKKLEQDKEQAYLSYELATIRCDAPIRFSPESAMVREPDNDALYALFVRLEFLRLIDRYRLHAPKPACAQAVPALDTCRTEIVADAARTGVLLAAYEAAPRVAVAVSGDLSSVAVSDGAQTACFSRHALGDAYRDFLKRLFSKSVSKTAHDVKSLQRALLENLLPGEGFVFDPALAAYLIDATQGDYGLKRLSAGYLNRELKTSETTDESLATEAETVYALSEPLSAQISTLGMDKLYYEIELPLCALLARMEHSGVLADQMALVAFGNMLSERITACEELIYRYAGQTFNINSPKQLGEILFEKLGLPPVKKTKSGYSTNADVLEKLKSKHPIIEAILDFRMLSKLKSTYADGLVKEISDDGRIHTTFQNMVTATGRLSSTEPNLQNIPVRTELGSEIRKMFIPADGCVFVDADYSQIELRILAHIAKDRHMIEAFSSGMDIHTATAAQVFDVEPSSVTPLMRRHAKAVNFGIVYGISEFSLAEDIGVTRKEARAYIDNYLANYSGVRQYMHDIVETAKRDGYVTTLFGRRRNLPELKSSNFNIRSFGERVALNTPIQGSAADIIKLAMLRVDEALRKNNLKAKLILQVHDELIVECPASEAETVKRLLCEQMQAVAELSVPLLAEAKCGASWYEAK